MGSVTECVRWSDYSSSVSMSFFQFWQDGLFTDVMVAVPGGAPVSAHRAVLAARSAELRGLLAHAAAGQQPGQPLLLLRGVSADQLRLLLQLLYTGRVQADQHRLHDRADSEAEEATERPLLRSTSVTSGEGGHGPDVGPHWERKPPDVTGSEAAYRHVSSLLEALDRRQLLQLRAQADQIMHPDFTSWLPDELLVNILSRLSPRDLLVAAGTCRRWQALSEDDGLWRRCLRLTGAALPVTGPGQPASLSRLYCIRHLAWTELPLPAPKVGGVLQVA
ncbi:Broad-complex core protein isoforms 1/2/3/4/5 [Amphibalanus amphitrite]|uniref:Broad-complex core protein isoforms 1/2/3/4/5 n=1 Tax=Amphibalanus amphitrite TaxID=1232801 RepID=A0A6A4WW92_AMPAM|nr:Broad-complex core protein isoforms 1/2/3/4/5 [Amphibalanus amphitrite]